MLQHTNLGGHTIQSTAVPGVVFLSLTSSLMTPPTVVPTICEVPLSLLTVSLWYLNKALKIYDSITLFLQLSYKVL